MSRPVAVLRPEPGGARTAARIEALGLVAVRIPLFVVRPLAWVPPDPARYDAVLMTSANAARHAGAGLAALAALPVVAVGAETAAEARAAGLTVALTGASDANAVIERARGAGFTRVLHLAGRDRAADYHGVESIATYTSDPLDPPVRSMDALRGAVVMLHSIRAARRFAMLAEREALDRGDIRVAAISASVAAAAGHGWGMTRVSDAPDDATLALVAQDLAIDPWGGGGDKAA